MEKIRRHDIDWLRVIAIGLLLIYHSAIGFQPWGVFIQFIQNNDFLEWIWVPMSMLNIWRIPLLFFVSGMGVYFAIQSRDWKALLLERSQRILLPYLFGMLTIVPLQILIWRNYYMQDLTYLPHPSHLWFLGNIFVYVLVCTPLFFYLQKNSGGKFQSTLDKILGNPLGLLLVTVPFIIEVKLVQPETFELYALTSHGFWIGFIAFIFGFLFIYSGKAFWKLITKWNWIFLAISVGLYFYRIQDGDFKSNDYLTVLESCCWIFSVLGLGHKYLNKPSETLTYLSQAAYPVYILHMFFLFLGSWLIFHFEIAAFSKWILVTLFTFMGSFGLYEFVIKRIWFLRPLFGLKLNRKMQELTNESNTNRLIDESLQSQ